MECGQVRRRTGGFTLVESVITMAIAAIVLASAVPSFSAMLEKQRLDGAVSRLTSDIQFAKAEAARRNEELIINFEGAIGGCYVLHTGAIAACGCSDDGTSVCVTGATALKSVGLGTDGSVRLSSNVNHILFSPLHGTSTPAGTMSLTAASGRAVRDIVNSMGSVRSCSPSAAAPAVPGYAAC